LHLVPNSYSGKVSSTLEKIFNAAKPNWGFLDPEGGSQTEIATLVVVVAVVVSSLRVQKCLRLS